MNLEYLLAVKRDAAIERKAVWRSQLLWAGLRWSDRIAGMRPMKEPAPVKEWTGTTKHEAGAFPAAAMIS